MVKIKNGFFEFFRVVGKSQSYKNLLYLIASFPLGVFYFIFLVCRVNNRISINNLDRNEQARNVDLTGTYSPYAFQSIFMESLVFLSH